MSLEAVTLEAPGEWLAWASGDGTERLLTAANFGAAQVTVGLPVEPHHRAILLSSTDPDRLAGEVDPQRFILLPHEAVVLLTRLVEAPGPST